ncbi:MAG: hypothetical protein DRN07_08680, partial [Thermoplasmata archaeon]
MRQGMNKGMKIKELFLKRGVPILLLLLFIFLSYLYVFHSRQILPYKPYEKTIPSQELLCAETDANNVALLDIINGELTLKTEGHLIAGRPITITTKNFEVVFYKMDLYRIKNVSNISNVTLRIRFMLNKTTPRWMWYGPHIDIPLTKTSEEHPIHFEQNSPVSKTVTLNAEGNYD